MVTDDNVTHEAQRSGFRGHERDPKEKVAQAARAALDRAMTSDLTALEHRVFLAVLHFTSTWGKTSDDVFAAQLAARVYGVDDAEPWHTKRVRKTLGALRDKGVIDYIPGRGHPGSGTPSRVSLIAGNEGAQDEGAPEDVMRGLKRANEGAQTARMRGLDGAPLPELPKKPKKPKKPKSGTPKRNRADERKVAELLRRDETRPRGLEAVVFFLKSQGFREKTIGWTVGKVGEALDKGVSIAWPFSYALSFVEGEEEDAAREERIEAELENRRAALNAEWERAKERCELCPHDALADRCHECKLGAMRAGEPHPMNNLGDALAEIL